MSRSLWRVGVALAAAALSACGGAAPRAPGFLPTTQGGRVVAVTAGENTVALFRVTDNQLAALELPPLPGSQFGWLDRRTLVVLNAEGGDEGGVVVSQVRDGELGPVLTVSEDEWPRPAFAQLHLVSSADAASDHDEIWISKCTFQPGDHECSGRSYLRLSPLPRVTRADPPDGAASSPNRVFHHDGDPAYPSPPRADAPEGVSLALAPGGTITLVTCTTRAHRTVYPAEAPGDGFEYAFRSVRWISTHPPLYEVAYDSVNPAGIPIPVREVFRACEAAPLRAYAWLGGELWAELTHAGDPQAVGTWTVYRGAVAIGTLTGGAGLRPAP